MTGRATPYRVRCSAVALSTFEPCRFPASLVVKDGRRTEVLRDGHPVCRLHLYAKRVIWEKPHEQ